MPNKAAHKNKTTLELRNICWELAWGWREARMTAFSTFFFSLLFFFFFLFSFGAEGISS